MKGRLRRINPQEIDKALGFRTHKDGRGFVVNFELLCKLLDAQIVIDQKEIDKAWEEK